MESNLAKKQSNVLAKTNEMDVMFGNDNKPQLPVDAPLPELAIMREMPLFKLPDGETAKEVTGHILYYHNANQHYVDKFGEGDERPNCYSSDGINPDGGTDQQSGPCASCKMNEYGSAREGDGKACSNTIRLYLLLDGDYIPITLKAPPSSLGKKNQLVPWLTNACNVSQKAGHGFAYQTIKAKFKLHTKDFSSGMSASVLDVETVRVLTAADDMDELRKLAGLTNELKAKYIALGRVKEDMAAEKVAPVTDGDENPGGGHAPEDDVPI